MSCEQGYYPFKRDDAPERFSIQTGIVCGLFGASHPLCKWVDEILPDIPVADALKDVGKQIAKRLRKAIKRVDWQALAAAQGNPTALQQILDWKRQIEQVNEIIDSIIDTIQGGEVSTLEFCLAGVPPLPEPINWGDVFLAFTGAYPDFLIDKLSGYIAYQKYFEYCECRKFLWKPELSPPVSNLYEPPIYDFVLGDNLCNPDFTAYVQTWINPYNQNAKNLSTHEAWRARIAQSLWLDLTNNTPFSGIPIENFEFFFCSENGEGETLQDELISVERIELSRCCVLKRNVFRRTYTAPRFDIKYDYYFQGELVTYWFVNGSYGPSPCEGESGSDQVYWYSIYSAGNECYLAPSGQQPLDTEVKDFPANLDPCATEFASNFGEELCKECNPCQELVADVRIIRNCEEFVEPRSLYWN